MDFRLNLDHHKVNKIFPFAFRVDEDLVIRNVGRSLAKLFPGLVGLNFMEAFEIVRPSHAAVEFQSLIDFSEQIFILKCKITNCSIRLRGEMLPLEAESSILFIGSPWLTSAGDLKNHQLKLSDFALHDSITDLLHYLKSKDIVSEDIRQLNLQLKDSEQKYRELVEWGSDMIFKFDQHGYITYVNEVTVQNLGYKKEELLGTSFTKFLDPHWQKVLLEDYSKLRRTGQSQFYEELPVIKKTGEVLWVAEHVQLQKEKGKVEFRVFAKDITHRKAMEDNLRFTELRLRQLITNLQAGVLVEDENRKIVLTNQFFCDLFGIPVPADQMKGADCSNAAEESKHLFSEPEQFVKRLNEILKKREMVIAEELLMQNGRVVERDYVPLFLEDEYLGHFWQYRDLTEKKMAERRLIKARKEAESARDAEKKFLAHMSHEIRTPLHVLIGMLHLMEDTELSERQADYLATLKNSAGLLENIISDILDMAKIESGSVEVKERQFNLKDLLNILQNIFQQKLQDSPVKVSIDIDPDIHADLIGDDILLNQILINLLGNAAKFTKHGRIGVRVSLLESSEQDQTLGFKVFDTGIGIASDNLQRIFEKFKQVYYEPQENTGGTGLGLTIVKELVEMQGGSIDVKSIPGQGTEFDFSLIYKMGRKAKLFAKAQNFVTQGQFFELQLLVVEDNLMNRKYISRLLEKWNVAHDFAVNGQEALSWIGQRAYDLILLDIQLPDLDGYEVAKRIRSGSEPNRDTPILAMTASAFSGRIDQAIRVGMDDYLIKPFTPQQLITKLKKFQPVAKDFSSSPFVFHNSLDQNRLFELYEGDLDYAADMFDNFLNNSVQQVHRISGIMEQGKWGLAKDTIHQLKPSFIMVGLTGLANQLDEIEKMLAAKGSNSEVHKKWKEALSLLEERVPVLKEDLNKMHNLLLSL